MREICYYVETRDGFFKMYLPEDYKLTLGPITVGAKTSKFSTNGEMERDLCLRIYEGTKQRGVFLNVVCFRDASIRIEAGTVHDDKSISWTELPVVNPTTVDEAKVINGKF